MQLDKKSAVKIVAMLFLYKYKMDVKNEREEGEKTDEKNLEEKCSWGFILACPNLPKPCTKRCSFYLDVDDDNVSEDEISRIYQEIRNYKGC